MRALSGDANAPQARSLISGERYVERRMAGINHTTAFARGTMIKQHPYHSTYKTCFGCAFSMHCDLETENQDKRRIYP
jgi:hypothetical protein